MPLLGVVAFFGFLIYMIFYWQPESDWTAAIFWVIFAAVVDFFGWGYYNSPAITDFPSTITHIVVGILVLTNIRLAWAIFKAIVEMLQMHGIVRWK